MTITLKYAHNLLVALSGSTKELQKKTLVALYEMATEGDFTRTMNKKVDAQLEKLLDDEDMADTVGEIYELLEKKIKTHLSKND